MSRTLSAVVLLVAVVLIATGCGGGLSAGTVYQKLDVPAHDETGIMPIYAGQTCVPIGKVESCTPRFIYVPYVYSVPEAFELKLRDCRTKDGSIDHAHCQTGTAYVDSTTFAATRVGAYYHRESGDATPPKRTPLHKAKG